MDIEQFAGWLGEIIASLLVPVLIYLAALLRRWRINDAVLKAVARGAGAAYLSIKEDQASLPAAVGAGAAYVEERLPATLVKAKLDTEAVRAMVRAELGTLLARKG